MRGVEVCKIALLSAWPLMVFIGLLVLEPRYLGALLLAVLLLASRRRVWALAGQFSPLDRAIMLASLAVPAAVVVVNDEVLLRLYPALVNLGLLAVFARSLMRPPSIIERVARLTEPHLPAAGVRYTRRVTQVWCAFFLLNGAIAAWTACAASRETWVLYNGAVAYALIAALLGGERLFRRHWLARTT